MKIDAVLSVGNPTHSRALLRVAMLAGLFAALVHMAYWLAVGPQESIGADRAHLFLIECQYPSLQQAFSAVGVDRYRPLSVWGEGSLTCLRSQPGLAPSLAVVLQMSILTGVAIALLVTVGAIATGSMMAALSGAVLFLFSNALLASNFVVLFSMMEVQPLICILLCVLGLQLRFQGQLRSGAILIIVGGLLGPWFREVGVIGPAVVLAMELLALPRRRSAFVIVPALLVLHGIMPVALPALATGQLSHVRWFFAGNEVGSNFQTHLVNWWRTGRLLNEVPGILWLFTIAAAAKAFAKLPTAGLRFGDLHAALCGRGVALAGQVGNPYVFAAAIAFSVGCLWVPFAHLSPPEASAMRDLRVEWLPILWMLGFLGLSAIRFGAILPIFALSLYLPLLRQPANYETHLPFVAAPLCLLVGGWLTELGGINAIKRSAFLRSALVTALGIAFAAQVQNIIQCYLTNRDLMQLTGRIGSWLAENVPARSVVFTNSFPSFEIFDRSGRRHDMRWIVPAGPITHVPAHAPILGLPAQERYAERAKGEGRATYYLLNVSAPQEANHPLPPAAELERLQAWQLVLPTGSLDPFRTALHKPQYMQVFAPFQWRTAVEHFDPQVTRGGTMVAYELLRLIPPSVPDPAPTAWPAPSVAAEPAPALIVDGYRDTGYNIIQAGSRFYAIARADGGFDLAKVKSAGYKSPIYASDTLADMQRQLDRGRSATPLPPAEAAPPRLVTDGFRGSQFNIVAYGDRFYGIARGNGSFDMGKVERGEYAHPVYVENGLADIEARLVKELNLR